MNKHRYILEPYKGRQSKYKCPSCGHDNRFVRYIDTETGQHIHPTVGRCDREEKCKYHYTPKQYFQDNKTVTVRKPKVNDIGDKASPQREETTLKPVSLIPFSYFERSLKKYEANSFIHFLLSHYDQDIVFETVYKYYVGTAKYWDGATVFWQIDHNNKIRTGKVMLYNAQTGKRTKEPYNHINWVHSILKIQDFNLSQCFFGEHLLKGHPEKLVCIVESEKTAIIANIFMPECNWLATGGKNGCRWTDEKVFRVLKNKTVVLWPDIGAYEKWKSVARNFSTICNISVSDLLEKNASEKERKEGYDLADYLVQYNLEDFNRTTMNGNEPSKTRFIAEADPIQVTKKDNSTLMVRKNKIEFDLNELFFFDSVVLPQDPIQIGPGETIFDVKKFVQSHIQTVRSNNGNEVYRPYYERLMKLKTILEKGRFIT